MENFKYLDIYHQKKKKHIKWENECQKAMSDQELCCKFYIQNKTWVGKNTQKERKTPQQSS